MQSQKPNLLADQEWILTNGIGGYALGFGNLINKRKYNGLLIASVNSLKRVHLVASIEERIETEGTYFYLDSNYYANCIYPNGYLHMIRSWLRPYPAFIYSSDPFSDNYLIFKEIFMVSGKNAVAVKYSNLSGMAISLTLRPKLTLRDHHFVNACGLWNHTGLEKKVRENHMYVKRLDNDCELYIYPEKGDMVETNTTYNSVHYPMEALRGYESVEDLISPLRIDLGLTPGESATIVFSSGPVDKPFEMAGGAELNYKKFPLPRSHPEIIKPLSVEALKSFNDSEFDKSSYHSLVEQAARDFVIGDDIIAGYPWFGPWGRDTLIAMDSFGYLPGGRELAKKILKKYGSCLRGGLLPNTFGEGGVGLNYDSIDAPLWYILQCYQYGDGDPELTHYISQIISGLLYEEDHPFHVDDDGLISIREGDYALTWMDAKIYNSPVTPRFGKPVEINALWYNALCIASGLIKKNNTPLQIKEIKKLSEKVRSSFQKFVGDEYLADRLENNLPIWEIRPNAVTALSLPFDCVGREIMRKVWSVAGKELLTPYGLRSLSHRHPAFKRKYIGNQKQRDLTYHQGTVWTYLLLPFVKLTLKALGGEKSPAEISKIAAGYVWDLRDGFLKGSMASVAEVWDGIDPYFPKGCPAQAWSVFGLLGIEGLISERDGGL